MGKDLDLPTSEELPLGTFIYKVMGNESIHKRGASQFNQIIIEPEVF